MVTDQKPLVGSRNIDPGSDPTGRRARWAIGLSTYDFVSVHCDGSKHMNAGRCTEPCASRNSEQGLR